MMQVIVVLFKCHCVEILFKLDTKQQHFHLFHLKKKKKEYKFWQNMCVCVCFADNDYVIASQLSTISKRKFAIGSMLEMNYFF